MPGVKTKWASAAILWADIKARVTHDFYDLGHFRATKDTKVVSGRSLSPMLTTGFVRSDM